MSDELSKPLLSICIPTFNRSSLLKVALLSLLEQMKGHEKDIEIIVSDNCSSDDTQQVAEWAKGIGPFRYNRNATNIGAGPNFMLLSNKLAQGEYCWLLGDDDFLRKGSLDRLVETIKANPEADMFFTNIQHIEVSLFSQMKEPVSSTQFPETLRTDSKNQKDQLLKSFDDLIDPDITPIFLGAMQCSIFRRKRWIEASSHVTVSMDNFRSVETTFPHAITLVNSMRGRIVFYFGDPVLVVGDGARDWERIFPMVAIVRLFELLDYYESAGIERSMIRKCRGLLIRNNTPSFVLLILLKNGKGPNDVDYRKTMSKFIGYREFWLSLIYVPITRLRTLTQSKSRVKGSLTLSEVLRFY